MYPKNDSPAEHSRPQAGKYRSAKAARPAVSLISLLLVAGTFLPGSAEAGILSAIVSSLTGKPAQENVVLGSGNLQTMALPKPAMNINPAPATGGADITIVDNSALLPEEGPSGTAADIVKPKNGMISTYVVREGDTLSVIAKMFGVKPSTVIWANDGLSSGATLKVGQVLTILPVTGVRYTVKKGDTLISIAKRYGGDAAEIASYNGVDDTGLVIGDEIIIPDGEIAAAPAPKSSGIGSEPAHNVGPAGTATQIGYYLRPIVGGLKTQGIHGYNAIDLAAPVGTAILAAASGDVIVAREGGWNGGYGSYVVIQHNNGSQTLYAHASDVVVSVGQHVVQGQVVGHVGRTGKATGPHVHFEIRNGIRNPF